jgi:hypothetical protein
LRVGGGALAGSEFGTTSVQLRGDFRRENLEAALSKALRFFAFFVRRRTQLTLVPFVPFVPVGRRRWLQHIEGTSLIR